MFLKRPLVQMLLASAILGVALWLTVHWFLGGTDEFSSSLDVRSYGYLREESQTPGGSADDSGSASDASATPGLVADAPLSISDIQRHEAVLKEQQISPEESTGEDSSELAEEEEAETEQQAEFKEEVDELQAADAQAAENSSSSTASEEDDSEHTGSLSDEELEARADARRKRLAELGLIQKKPHEPTIAVDVSLLMPDQCKGAVTARVPIGLKYRYESSIIRGESLNALESLVALYRLCEQGAFVVDENPLGFEDATPTLTQMRFDEVKYFFIQHSISIDTVQFPEEE